MKPASLPVFEALFGKCRPDTRLDLCHEDSPCTGQDEIQLDPTDPDVPAQQFESESFQSGQDEVLA